MEKDVLVDVHASREFLGESDEVDFTVAGEMEHTDDGYRLSYLSSHSIMGMLVEESVQTDITVSGESVRVMRGGMQPTDVFLQQKTPYTTEFDTPIGRMPMQVLPTFVSTEMQEDRGNIELEYVMNIAGEQIVDRLSLTYRKDKSRKEKAYEN